MGRHKIESLSLVFLLLVSGCASATTPEGGPTAGEETEGIVINVPGEAQLKYITPEALKLQLETLLGDQYIGRACIQGGLKEIVVKVEEVEGFRIMSSSRAYNLTSEGKYQVSPRANLYLRPTRVEVLSDGSARGKELREWFIKTSLVHELIHICVRAHEDTLRDPEEVVVGLSRRGEAFKVIQPWEKWLIPENLWREVFSNKAQRVFFEGLGVEYIDDNRIVGFNPHLEEIITGFLGVNYPSFRSQIPEETSRQIVALHRYSYPISFLDFVMKSLTEKDRERFYNEIWGAKMENDIVAVRDVLEEIFFAFVKPQIPEDEYMARSLAKILADNFIFIPLSIPAGVEKIEELNKQFYYFLKDIGLVAGEQSFIEPPVRVAYLPVIPGVPFTEGGPTLFFYASSTSPPNTSQSPPFPLTST